ncbi:Transcriptional regulatory protein SEF1 [Pseudocercospora fuligena]|uniref:Transcriptional regulatory protein SEF1 n=1 Tax=Pseudocercospora fuligena TaxID=685502 RepID=A0A8H6RVM9_9PEZI|nr:Transcriptional regulatory protein SEF1 [Pseudocercospora fuligena]
MPDPVGRVKACTECRQQKVRCDAYLDYSRACTRCRAGNLPCVISKDFQRRPRQSYVFHISNSVSMQLMQYSKAQLQHEIDRLKAKVEGDGDHENHSESTPDQFSPPIRSNSDSRHVRFDGSPIETSKSLPTPASHASPAKSLRDVLKSSSPAEGTYDSSQFTQYDATLTRSLQNVTIESYHIDECYNIFLTHYGPHLDGLFEDSLTPNERYQQSPLLFWTILLVGSRGYPKDSTIYDRLGEHVLELAFKSMIRPNDPLPVIVSAVIICTWPLPFDMVYRDPTQALAGAAYGLAIQNGLHMYAREQDFIVKSTSERSGLVSGAEVLRSRVRDAAVIARTRIWVYCLLTFQNGNIGDGLPPTAIVPCFRRAETFGEVYHLLPKILGYRLQTHRVKTEAVNVIASSCDIVGKHKDDSLTATILALDGRIREYPRPENNDIYNIIRCGARLSVLSLIWLVQTEPDHILILRVYGIAQEMIAHMQALNESVQSFTFYLPQSTHRLLVLAACVILRISKSPLAKDIDLAGAEAAVFAVIDIIRKRCLHTADLYALAANMLTQLWSSKKAFSTKNPASASASSTTSQVASDTEQAMPFTSMSYSVPMAMPTATDGLTQPPMQFDNLFSDLNYMDFWDLSALPSDLFQGDMMTGVNNTGMMMSQDYNNNFYTAQ